MGVKITIAGSCPECLACLHAYVHCSCFALCSSTCIQQAFPPSSAQEFVHTGLELSAARDDSLHRVWASR